MKISVITYTYNDAEFLDGLMDNIASWGVPIHEILVADDASDVSPDLSGFNGVTLCRNSQNIGPAKNKEKWWPKLSGDLLISIDCDIRLHKKFVRSALTYLAMPEVGMVGSGKYLFSNPATLASQWHNQKVRAVCNTDDGYVDFIHGGVMLMRREVLDQVKTIAFDTCEIGEDVKLSSSVRDLGLRVVSLNKYNVYQARLLSVVQSFRQNLIYGGYSAVRYAIDNGLEQYAVGRMKFLSDSYKGMKGQKDVFVYPLMNTALFMLFVKEKLRGTNLEKDFPCFDRYVSAIVRIMSVSGDLLRIFKDIVSEMKLSVYGVCLDGDSDIDALLADIRVEELEKAIETGQSLRMVQDEVTNRNSAFHYLDGKEWSYGDYINYEAIVGSKIVARMD